MSYVVNWRGSDGQAGWHPVEDLQQAAAQVEHLRNVDGVDAIKIFQLDEVAFEFRPYYRVELATEAPPARAAVVAPPPEPERAPEPVAEVAWAEPVEAKSEPVFAVAPPAVAEATAGGEDAAANGQRRGLFGR